MPPRDNPLIPAGGDPGRHERGSDAAGQQLQEHCDRLNRMTGDKYWFVSGKAPERRIDCTTKASTQSAGPRPSPSEVSDIMRKFGIR